MSKDDRNDLGHHQVTGIIQDVIRCQELFIQDVIR
jgi:hypothetical protein